MKQRSLLIVALSLALLAPRLHGDIAPTQFIGHGIAPDVNSSVRMMSADVDITWGMPCTLSAVFVMENATTKDARISLGFPLLLPRAFRGKDSLDFSITFNGQAADPATISKESAPKESYDTYTTWYRCRHIFPPGQSIVTIKTKLPASAEYDGPYQENLNYCIGTGASWAGTIGRECVTIHFPRSLTPEMVLEVKPPGAKVEGSTIRWHFADFKPIRRDHDITFRYLRPDVADVLFARRKEHEEHPNDPQVTLKLAKDLFALIPYRQFAWFPPARLRQSSYDKLVKAIADQHDVEVFKSQYAPDGLLEFRNINDDWTDEQKILIRILNEADYQPENKSRYVDEAKGLMEQLLKNEPHNAEVWNIFLANNFKMRFAGDGYPFSDPPYCFPHEVNLAKEAYEKCPDDPTLQLWYRRATGYAYDEYALHDQIKQRGFRGNDFPKLEYDQYN